MARGFWAARRPGWVAGGALLAVASLTVWLLRAKSGGDTATVLSLTVSIVALGVAVWGLRPAPSLSQTARDLAGRVAQERGRARRQALGMTGDAQPAELAFRPPLPGEELVRWRSDGGVQQGTLSDAAAYYQSLERGRLVVLGEPGAGKTVLATQLVIDLAKALPAGELQPGARPVAPVWLSLPSLDLGEPASLGRLSAEELEARLDGLIAAQVSQDYQIAAVAAQRLVRERWVLPVLDGLDEMDSSAARAGGTRPLAAAVVRALNAGTGRRPVVLVCRHAEYGQLARSASRPGEDPVLQDATQIVLQRLDAEAICEFLARRFPGGRAGEPDARWADVWHALRRGPAAGQEDSLADALSSPWQLFLATAAYSGPGTDPSELTRLPASTLGERLLAQFIPAVTSSTPRGDGEFYPASEASTWLETLARHLEGTSKHLGWSATDLRLERLWPIGGQKAVRWLSALVISGITCAAFALAGLVWAAENGRWYPDTRPAWIGFGCGVIAVIGSVIYFTRSTDRTLQRLDLKLGSAAARKRLAGGLLMALSVGGGGVLGLGLTYGHLPGFAGGSPEGLAGTLTLGLAIGLAIGLAFGLQGTFSLAERPTSVMRQNLAYVVMVGLTFAVASGLASELADRLRDDVGIVLATALGLAFALTLGLDVWVRYLIGCSVARRRGLLPRRVGRFLDWAYQANLLRMSGTAIQFRHRELQAWLTAPARVSPVPAVRPEAAPQQPAAAPAETAPEQAEAAS